MISGFTTRYYASNHLSLSWSRIVSKWFNLSWECFHCLIALKGWYQPLQTSWWSVF